MEEKVYQFWLHQLPGVGDRTIEKLLSVFGSAKEVCLAGNGLKRVLGQRAVERVLEFNKTFDAKEAVRQRLNDAGMNKCWIKSFVSVPWRIRTIRSV